jgi:macrodomain Ter protein organizer (MatP/YcbG family)
MPFKSRAQRRKFAKLLVKGEISPATFEEWNRETGSARLPERTKQLSKARKKRAKSSARSKPRRKATNRSKKKATRRSR